MDKFDELFQGMIEAKRNLDSAFMAMEEYLLGALDTLSEKERQTVYYKLISLRDEA